jgi:hypothetical protein
MANFTAKLLFIICILLFGVLLGIHQAELGMLAIGNFTPTGEAQEETEESPAEEGAGENNAQHDHDTEAELADGQGDSEYITEETYITRIDGDEVEVAVIGQAIDLEEQEQGLLAEDHHNRYSKVGSTIGNIIYSITQSGAEWFASQLEKVF